MEAQFQSQYSFLDSMGMEVPLNHPTAEPFEQAMPFSFQPIGEERTIPVFRKLRNGMNLDRTSTHAPDTTASTTETSGDDRLNEERVASALVPAAISTVARLGTMDFVASSEHIKSIVRAVSTAMSKSMEVPDPHESGFFELPSRDWGVALHRVGPMIVVQDVPTGIDSGTVTKSASALTSAKHQREEAEERVNAAKSRLEKAKEAFAQAAAELAIAQKAFDDAQTEKEASREQEAYSSTILSDALKKMSGARAEQQSTRETAPTPPPPQSESSSPSTPTSHVPNSPQSGPKLFPPNFPQSVRPYRHVGVWRLEDMNMVLGSDLVVLGNEDHPKISLYLQDTEVAGTLTEGKLLELAFDNMMVGIPELAICFHRDNVVQRYKVYSTQALIEQNQTVAQRLLRTTLQVLRWLKQVIHEEGQTYWLGYTRIPSGAGALTLHNLSHLAQSQDHSQSSPRPSPQFTPRLSSRSVLFDPQPFLLQAGLLYYRSAMSVLESSPRQLRVHSNQAERLLQLSVGFLQRCDSRRSSSMATSSLVFQASLELAMLKLSQAGGTLLSDWRSYLVSISSLFHFASPAEYFITTNLLTSTEGHLHVPAARLLRMPYIFPRHKTTDAWEGFSPNTLRERDNSILESLHLSCSLLERMTRPDSEDGESHSIVLARGPGWSRILHQNLAIVCCSLLLLAVSKIKQHQWIQALEYFIRCNTVHSQLQAIRPNGITRSSVLLSKELCFGLSEYDISLCLRLGTSDTLLCLAGFLPTPVERLNVAVHMHESQALKRLDSALKFIRPYTIPPPLDQAFRHTIQLIASPKLLKIQNALCCNSFEHMQVILDHTYEYGRSDQVSMVQAKFAVASVLGEVHFARMGLFAHSRLFANNASVLYNKLKQPNATAMCMVNIGSLFVFASEYIMSVRENEAEFCEKLFAVTPTPREGEESPVLLDYAQRLLDSGNWDSHGNVEDAIRFLQINLRVTGPEHKVLARATDVALSYFATAGDVTDDANTSPFAKAISKMIRAVCSRGFCHTAQMLISTPTPGVSAANRTHYITEILSNAKSKGGQNPMLSAWVKLLTVRVPKKYPSGKVLHTLTQAQDLCRPYFIDCSTNPELLWQSEQPVLIDSVVGVIVYLLGAIHHASVSTTVVAQQSTGGWRKANQGFRGVLKALHDIFLMLSSSLGAIIRNGKPDSHAISPGVGNENPIALFEWISDVHPFFWGRAVEMTRELCKQALAKSKSSGAPSSEWKSLYQCCLRTQDHRAVSDAVADFLTAPVMEPK